MRVRFVRSWQLRGGAFYGIGERADLPTPLAEALSLCGIVQWDDVAPSSVTREESPTMTPKAVSRPPKDKMIRRAPRTKGGARRVQ